MADLTTAMILAALILTASIASVESGISVAIIEIALGVVAATFITDFGTAFTLSVLFTKPSPYLALFVVASVLVVAVMVALQRPFFARYGGRVIEPEIKGAFLALFVLMWTADLAGSHAVP